MDLIYPGHARNQQELILLIRISPDGGMDRYLHQMLYMGFNNHTLTSPKLGNGWEIVLLFYFEAHVISML